ncbi:hypothetical protein PAPYR_2656 [Paratrimastix pyriformis]|uniref:Uncharacterized protein n=1 Tax=Paratrimastix pyriformis TaxID=342808 RepID=A0ABQ8UPT0_9EUKA|nr:hypothetical protein PAPYR_2656 [Paratrimastix pyriformis]
MVAPAGSDEVGCVGGLATLDLTSNELTSEGMGALAEALLTGPSSLRHLVLDGNRCGPDTARLARGVCGSCLESLSLCSTHTPLQLDCLSLALAPPHCVQYLGANRITDEGVTPLAQALASPRCGLRALYLWGENAITDAGALALASALRLRAQGLLARPDIARQAATATGPPTAPPAMDVPRASVGNPPASPPSPLPNPPARHPPATGAPALRRPHLWSGAGGSPAAPGLSLATAGFHPALLGLPGPPPAPPAPPGVARPAALQGLGAADGCSAPRAVRPGLATLVLAGNAIGPAGMEGLFALCRDSLLLGTLDLAHNRPAAPRPCGPPGPLAGLAAAFSHTLARPAPKPQPLAVGPLIARRPLPAATGCPAHAPLPEAETGQRARPAAPTSSNSISKGRPTRPHSHCPARAKAPLTTPQAASAEEQPLGPGPGPQDPVETGRPRRDPLPPRPRGALDELAEAMRAQGSWLRRHRQEWTPLLPPRPPSPPRAASKAPPGRPPIIGQPTIGTPPAPLPRPPPRQPPPSRPSIARPVPSPLPSPARAGCPWGLQALNLGWCDLGPADSAALAAAVRNTSSLKVPLPRHPPQPYHPPTGDGGGLCVGVQVLVLDGNSLQEEGLVRLFSGLHHSPTLAVLSLAHVSGIASPSALAALAALLRAPDSGLDTLDLASTELAEPQASALVEALAGAQRIRLLCLDGNRLGDPFFEALAALPPYSCSGLQELSACNNLCGARGATALGEGWLGEGRPDFAVLRLWGNPIPYEGRALLLRASQSSERNITLEI